MSSTTRAASLLLAAALVTGCGAMRFNRAWDERAAAPAPTTGLEGRWAGEWRSEWNGHSGGLRCLLTPAEGGAFHAWFLSSYARVFTFAYEMLLHVTAEEAGTLRFEGEQDLGKMAGGLYRYAGTVTGDSFHATFEAENGDHGVFEMKRVPPGSD
jgi:hypothetical protein